MVERYLYTPYGEVRVLDGDFSSDADGNSDYSNTTLYTGRTFDPAIGLYYYRHRVYHAQLGRFVSRDPVGYGGDDINLSAYVTSSPIGHTDPTGFRRHFLEKCAITVFIGHDKNISAFIKKNRIQYQTGCYYSTVITCNAKTVAASLPSLMPGAPISAKRLDWYKKKPGVDFGPDVWEDTKKAAEKAAQTLLKRPCCCAEVAVVVKCIGGFWECKARFPKLDSPEPFK